MQAAFFSVIVMLGGVAAAQSAPVPACGCVLNERGWAGDQAARRGG